MVRTQNPTEEPKPVQHAGEGPPASGHAHRERNILVRDHGFEADDWTADFLVWDDETRPSGLPDCAALDVENTAQADRMAPVFDRVSLIRIAFPSHTDGRGFSLARHLRLLGFQGRLRASGHILADQYAMARRSGFDEVEITPSLAERQPEAQWRFRANWQTLHYQERLREPPLEPCGPEQT